MTSTDWHYWFEYHDGWLFWKVRPSKKVRIGDLVGNKNGAGYWQFMLKGKNYMVARVIWEMHHGLIEEGFEIDHKDRDLDNNRIENLRKVTHSINLHNREDKPNVTGFRGVQVVGSKYHAQIQHKGERKYLGSFETAVEASEAYERAKAEVH